MSATTQPIARGFDLDRALNTLAAWVLALLWILPLAYAVWTAIHPSSTSQVCMY